MKKQTYFIALLTAGLYLISCAKNAPTPSTNVDADAIRTEAVSTFASSLTQTAAVSPTTVFTPTAEITETLAITGTAETALPQNTCYNLLFIKDVTIPDGTFMGDNEVFTKTWQVQNNGDCAWAPGFSFSHVGGETLRGKTFVLTEPIPVGAKREISIEMIAPAGLNGLVQSSWRMADANGAFFGDTLTVNIMVGNRATATPTP
jgi:hypothetical protein